MDFQQGLITTIHEYGVTRNLLKELNKSLKKRSTSILIPCLYEEFERPALKDIREVLKNLTGLNELVIALSAKTVEQVKAAKSFFDSMPFPVHVQWTLDLECLLYYGFKHLSKMETGISILSMK